MSRRPGVFCLETSWADDGRDLTDKASVEQQLRMLQGAEQCGDVIHRDVATTPEFNAYLKEWLRPRYVKDTKPYPLAYFAFHGFRGGIKVGQERMTLEALAQQIGPARAEGRIFYFGSCATMQATEKELRSFCRSTGAKAIVGYTKDVTWRESAAFDCLLVPASPGDAEYEVCVQRALPGLQRPCTTTGSTRGHPQVGYKPEGRN